MEAQLVTAPGDGISPAVLLTLGQRLKAQYLFNIPEGFARFVLEHKVRPTANLRAAFATDLQALAGFGGLVMRLRGEGHGQVQVLGPAGTQAVVSSLRHFIHWKHPAVLLSELSEWETPVCYEDEHIAVAAIWKPPLVPELWRAPAWLLAPVSGPKQTIAPRSNSSSEADSSSSSEEESSSTGREESDSSSSGSSSGEEEAGGSETSQHCEEEDGGSGAAAEEERQRASPPPAVAAAPNAVPGEAPPPPAVSMFEELDQIFMRGGGRAGGGRGRALATQTRSSVLERLRAGQGPPQPPAPAGAGRQNGAAPAAPAAGVAAAAPRRPKVAVAAAVAAAAAAPAPRRRPAASQQPAVATGAASTGEGKVYVVGGKPYRQLHSASGISVWTHDKLSSRSRTGVSPNGAIGRGSGSGAVGGGAPSAALQSPAAPPPLLGFLCHIKATDQLLLVGSLRGKATARELAEHPALERLLQQGARVAGTILMADAGQGRTPQFRRLLAGLPGQHILLERPGPGRQDIGHLAAARTTAKLHLVAPSIFPLPASLAAAAAAASKREGQQRAVAIGSRESPGPGQPEVEGSALEGEDAPDKAFPAAEAAGGGPSLAESPVAVPEGAGPSAEAETTAADQQQRQQQGQQQQGGMSAQMHQVRQLSRAVWGAGGAPMAAGTAAAAAAAEAGASPQQPFLLQPVEVFSPEAAAGRGAEGRPSGADPAAVWRELGDSKPELPGKLAELEGVLAALTKLPSQPRAGPIPNRVRPGAAAPAPGGAVNGASHHPPLHPHDAWQPQQHPQQQQPGAPGGQPLGQGFPHPLPPPPPYQQPQHPSGVQFLPPPPHNYPVHHFPPPSAAPPGMVWVLQPSGPYPPPQPQQQRQQPFPPPQQQHYPPPAHALPPRPGFPPPPYPPPYPQVLAGHQHMGGPALGQPPPPPGSPPPAQPQGSVVPSVLGKRPGGPAQPGQPGLNDGRPQQQQEEQREGEGEPPSNKRAAADLRAKLKRKAGPEGSETAPPEQPNTGRPASLPAATAAASPAAPGDGGQPAAAAARAAAGGACTEEGGPGAGLGPWAEGAPECLRALAAAQDGTQVAFLGTGSAEPSKYRGASAIHLRLGCGQGLLLDCGEGCLGQMQRLYGHRAALRQVAALGCIWLSHRHADHMLGLLGVLGAYPPHLPPLLVVGPHSARDWLSEAAPHLRLRYVFAHCSELNRPGHWARQQLAERLGLVQFESVGVRHCSDAFGAVLAHRSGWKLLYSGDTQPCDRLVQAGRGCTLLIHEATFEPCLADQAQRKRHSTTDEALAVAQAMGAYRTILTHFSQRYPKFPEGLPAEGPAAGSTAIAFDGMCVPLSALPLLPALRPAVEYVLASEEEQPEGEGEATGGGGNGAAA